MGGIRAIKAASLATLQELSWLPDAVGQAIYDKANPDGATAPEATDE